MTTNNETTVLEQNRVTAGFTIKRPGPVAYSSDETTVFVPLTIPHDATEDDIETLAERALGMAKRVAAAGIGIDTELTVADDGTEAVKLIEEAFPEAPPKKTAQASKARPKATGGSGGRGPNKTEYGHVTVLNQIEAGVPDWLNDHFQEMVGAGKIDPDDNEVWDNRKFSPDFGGSGNPKAPWFKTSNGGVALDFGGDPVDLNR